jgi:hypothetical protein
LKVELPIYPRHPALFWRHIFLGGWTGLSNLGGNIYIYIIAFLFKEALHVCNPVGLYSSLGNEMPPHINIINIASVLDLWGI